MEIWKEIPGRERFMVSNLGNVKALAFQCVWRGRTMDRPEKLVKKSNHSAGYQVVALGDNKKHFIHRIVMLAFVGPPTGRQDVNHIDGNKHNNALENLEYCDRMHNVRHAIATGLQDNSGENNGQSKYRESDIRRAYQLVMDGASYTEANRLTGVSVGMIQQVVNGKRWKHLKLGV